MIGKKANTILIFLVFLTSCSLNNKHDKDVAALVKTNSSDTLKQLLVEIPEIYDTCLCNSSEAERIIKQKTFNSIAEYDSKTFNKRKFYNLDSQVNRLLWFRDIENPTKTKFTDLWDSYWVNNYYANSIDFMEYYKGKKDIPLAFIFGPNNDLWAYHIFVIRKVGCCYLITRSYYRHNRFNYKAYSIFDNTKLKDLYNTLSKISVSSLDSNLAHSYKGYFTDNLNGNKFFIDFEKETVESKDSSNNVKRTPKPEIRNLYKFVDTNFHWQKTYEL